MKLLLLVLGFHRSGTSALTRALHALGADIGCFENEHNPENPRGFFEHPDARAVNEQLFALFGSAWWDVRFDAWRAEAMETPLGAQRALARSFIAKELEGAGVFALKDPRIMNFLWFWLPLFERAKVEVVPILILRRPAECAQSQMARAKADPIFYAGLNTSEGVYALWCRYHANALNDLLNRDLRIVAHQDLITQPTAVLRALAEAVFPADTAGSADHAAQTIEPALYRHRSADAEADERGFWGERAQALFEWLIELGPNGWARAPADLRFKPPFEKAASALASQYRLSQADGGRAIYPRFLEIRQVLRAAASDSPEAARHVLASAYKIWRYDAIFPVIEPEFVDLCLRIGAVSLGVEVLEAVLARAPETAWARAQKQALESEPV